MKFNVAAAAASAAFLAGAVNADEQKVLKDESSVAESATKAAPVLPTFTVSLPQSPCASPVELRPTLATRPSGQNTDAH